MPLLRYEFIHKDKVEHRIYDRYADEIQRLEMMGFHDLTFIREIAFPFSALLLSPVMIPMWYKREIFRVERPLRLVLLNVLMTNVKHGAYVQVFGLGAKFYTRFTDGTILVTTPTNDDITINLEQRFHKYGVGGNKPSMALVWQSHKRQVIHLEDQGREIDHDLSLQTFEEMSEKEARLGV